MEGHPGVVIDVDVRDKRHGPVQCVKLGIIDQSTGVETVRWYPIDRLRRPVELFGSILRGKTTIQMKLLGTCTALSTLFAREALLSMMLDFEVEEKQALLEAPSLVTRRETLVTLIEYNLRGGSSEEILQ